MTTFYSGRTDALTAYGLAKESRFNPTLGSTLGGAAAGFMLAPEGEGAQGAALGATGGYLGARMLGGGFKGLRNAGAGLMSKLPGMAASTNPLLSRSAARPMLPGMPSRPLLPTGNSFLQRTPTPFKVAGVKQAALEFGVGTQIPGTPIGVSTNFKGKTERLNGMDRWVNQDVIERAFKGTSEGLDAQALMDLEAQRGSLLHPLLGGGAAAALSKYKVPSAGNLGAALAGLLGAGAGAFYNQVTSDNRREDMSEALRGVYGERGFPVRGQAHSTATESQPMLVSRGGGSA